MFWLKKTPGAHNDTFVTLVLLAQDDPEFKLMLRDILNLPQAERKYLLKTAIVDMESAAAPAEFIAAIACLVDDEMAVNTLALISKEG